MFFFSLFLFFTFGKYLLYGIKRISSQIAGNHAENKANTIKCTLSSFPSRQPQVLGAKESIKLLRVVVGMKDVCRDG